MLHDGDYSCVIEHDGALRVFTRRGVADLYDLYRHDPGLLSGARVADRVVGRAAAALMIEGGVAELHAGVVSTGALELLGGSAVRLSFEREVPHIADRTGTGQCPLEERCRTAATAAECLARIDDFVSSVPSDRFERAKQAAFCLLLGVLPMGGVRAGEADSLAAGRVHPIGEVVVTGARAETDPRLLPLTVSSVGRRKIEAGGRSSLLPLLSEQVPGLFVTSRGLMGYGVSTGAAGGMTLRGVGGSPTAGLLVLVDGQPQYMGLMGHPIADACRSMLAERVEVVRGPASVLYGSNAMGGVVNIVTRKISEPGWHSDLRASCGSYNTLRTEWANRMAGRRLSATVTLSYDRTDGHRPDMGFEQYGGYAGIGCRLNRVWRIDADLDLTRFYASNPGPVAAPLIDNDSRITRGRTSVSLRNDSGRASGAVTLYWNWGLHCIDDGYSPGAEPPDYRFRSHDEMAGFSWYESFSLFAGNRLTAGIDCQRFGGRAVNRYLADGTEKLLADKTMYETAVYADFRQSLTRWLIFDAGLRFDYHSHAGGEWIPQAGVSLLLPRDAQIKMSVAKGFRFPTIREMYMFPPQNPDLKPERTIHCELSFSQRLADGRFSYVVNLYRIDGDDLILLQPFEGRRKYMNTGRIENCGAEGDLSWRFARGWTLEANYSWLHMQYPVVAAPEHKLFCGIGFVKSRWSVSTGVQYVRGLCTQTDPVLTERFALWNADLAFRATRRVELFVRGENLLAERYEINAGYPMPRATVMGGVNLHFN